VLIGGTELLTPDEFISQLARLNGEQGGGFAGAGGKRANEEIDLDDLIIE
jgi:hypothetical protein